MAVLIPNVAAILAAIEAARREAEKRKQTAQPKLYCDCPHCARY